MEEANRVDHQGIGYPSLIVVDEHTAWMSRPDLTRREAHAFQGGDKAAIQAQPAKTVPAAVFNEHAADTPWRRVEVRRALNMAIDRDAVVERGVHGYGSVIPAFIQPAQEGVVRGSSSTSTTPRLRAVPDLAAHAVRGQQPGESCRL